MHQEILALIENLLGNLITTKLEGVLSLRLTDHEFGCRDCASDSANHFGFGSAWSST
jgi:hypothetical protein